MTYSDFEAESDLHDLSPSPPPSTRTDTELNIAVLRRHDPTILSIQHVSPYAVVYTFSPAISAWEKYGIEGSAFLVQLAPTTSPYERYAVMVLNRRGLENFFVELTSTEDVEVTSEYIILQGSRGGEVCVYGLWIFAEPEPASTAHQREEMSRKIMDCAERIERSRQFPGAEDTGYEGEEEGDGSVELEGEEFPHGSERLTPQGEFATMLGQNRAADDSWSIRSHSPQPPVQGSQPLFTNSADANFFLAAARPAPRKSHSPAVSVQSNPPGGQVVGPEGQRNILLDLFKKAGDAHHAWK